LKEAEALYLKAIQLEKNSYDEQRPTLANYFNNMG